MKKDHKDAIKKKLLTHYKDAQTELNYTNDYELLIAIILSAQCTDKRVNLITPELFKTFPTPSHLSMADLQEVKELIKTCSFFNNKAHHLIKMAQTVMGDFKGKIPQTQQELTTLAGVGQKTANVFMSEFLGKNYMAVDTHVFRTSHRLKLSSAKTIKQTEADLTNVFKTDLNLLHQAMVLFGRYICKAKKPLCHECFLSDLCTSQDKISYEPSAQ